jgi:hypothetical protein
MFKKKLHFALSAIQKSDCTKCIYSIVLYITLCSVAVFSQAFIPKKPQVLPILPNFQELLEENENYNVQKSALNGIRYSTILYNETTLAEVSVFFPIQNTELAKVLAEYLNIVYNDSGNDDAINASFIIDISANALGVSWTWIGLPENIQKSISLFQQITSTPTFDPSIWQTSRQYVEQTRYSAYDLTNNVEKSDYLKTLSGIFMAHTQNPNDLNTIQWRNLEIVPDEATMIHNIVEFKSLLAASDIFIVSNTQSSIDATQKAMGHILSSIDKKNVLNSKTILVAQASKSLPKLPKIKKSRRKNKKLIKKSVPHTSDIITPPTFLAAPINTSSQTSTQNTQVKMVYIVPNKFLKNDEWMAAVNFAYSLPLDSTDTIQQNTQDSIMAAFINQIAYTGSFSYAKTSAASYGFVTGMLIHNPDFNQINAIIKHITVDRITLPECAKAIQYASNKLSFVDFTIVDYIKYLQSKPNNPHYYSQLYANIHDQVCPLNWEEFYKKPIIVYVILVGNPPEDLYHALTTQGYTINDLRDNK